MYVISGRGYAQLIGTVREYSMGFKVPISREEIGESFGKCSVNRDISLNYPLFIKGEKEIRLFLEGRSIVA